jgi:ketosteroid isomerase-like protein
MKKIIITLALLIFSFAGFSQKIFTQATLDELVNEYKKDSKAFFNNRLSEDFRYINRKGGFQYQKAFLGGTAQNIVSTEMPQAVIFQSGDLAVTSGIHKTVRIDKDGKEVTDNIAVTYTFQRRNDKWMFVGSQQNNIQAPVAEDEEAIKKALETSTAYMYAADYDAYKKTWVNAPYITRVSVDAAGQVSRMSAEEYSALLEDYRKNYKTPTNIKITRSNFAIRINGTSAFVVFNQHNDNADGTQRDSIEERYLEKVNGEWKIVNVTVIPKK